MPWQDKVQKFMESIFSKLDEQIEDISKLDVTTMTANAVDINVEEAFEKDLDFKALKGSVNVVGITRIDADGDYIEMLQGDSDGKLTIDDKLLKIHQANVKSAAITWNNYFRNLIEITAIIAAIVAPNKDRVDLIKALKTNLEPLGKTE